MTTGFKGNLNAEYPGGLETGCGTDGANNGNTGGTGEGGAGDGGSGGGTGGGGGGGGAGDGAGAGAGEGKVLNALMTATRLSDGTVLGSALTDPQQGLVTIRPRKSDGPVLLTLTGQDGALYYDEGKNQMLPFGPGRVLHALIDQFDENIGVTMLTEAAYRYALNNFGKSAQAGVVVPTPADPSELRGLTSEQVRAANQAVLAEINTKLDTKVQMPSVKTLPTPVDSSSPTNALPLNRYGIAATVIGGLVKAAAKQQPTAAAPGIGITEQLARDFTDGKLNGVAKDNTPAAPAAQAFYEPQTLSGTLRNGTAAMSSQFGQGTTSTVTPPATTIADFVGPFIFSYIVGELPPEGTAPDPSTARGVVAGRIDAAGNITGRFNSAVNADLVGAITGTVAADGTVTSGANELGITFSGTLSPAGAGQATGSGTWSDGTESGTWVGGVNNTDPAFANTVDQLLGS
jgi:hypothetical protein